MWQYAYQFKRALRWRHNEQDSVSNHQPHHCLLNRLLRADQSSASLAFVRGIHRGPVNSPHKWPVTRKMFPFDDVIMGRHNDSRKASSFLHMISNSYSFKHLTYDKTAHFPNICSKILDNLDIQGLNKILYNYGNCVHCRADNGPMPFPAGYLADMDRYNTVFWHESAFRQPFIIRNSFQKAHSVTAKWIWYWLSYYDKLENGNAKKLTCLVQFNIVHFSIFSWIILKTNASIL